MRRWLGGIAAFLLCAATAGASAAAVDCGPAPDVKCIAAEVFALAKTLPADDFARRHVAFAEKELAPGDIAVALEYVVTDNPDPAPWEDIYWMAKAGRIDLALKQARQRQAPAERVGGLIAVAEHLLDRNDAARALKIVEEAERQLPAISSDDNAIYRRQEVGELWVRLGQPARGARLIAGAESVSALLAIAEKYPAAARLREQAWHEAERANDPRIWRFLVEDAIKRGDQADAARAAQTASKALGAVDRDRASYVIDLARLELAAGLPEPAASLIKPWPQWLGAKGAASPPTIVMALMPVLAGLTRDQDTRTAAGTVENVAYRSQCLARAAEENYLLGRVDVAEQFDADALGLAEASPTGEPKLQWAHDAALHNLALMRAGHGDIQGAFGVVAKLRDEAKVREVMTYVVRRAIDNGHTPVVGPAIEALQEMALAAQDAGLLLQAADRWHEVGSDNKARNSLVQATRLIDSGQAKLAGKDFALLAELTWRLEASGKPEALLDIVDRIGVTDASAIDHLVEIVKTVSPAVAVQLANRQADVERRIDELANIGLQVAAKAK
jgi:hypothetical protein